MKEGKLHICLGLLQEPLSDRHIHLNREASIVSILRGESCNSYFVLVSNLLGLLDYVSLAKRRQKGRVTILGAIPWLFDGDVVYPPVVDNASPFAVFFLH